jgi:large subunit ribosomal protein L9
LEIKIASKVGAGDKLFGSVTNNDLAEAISTQTSEIDKKHISLPGKTIKRLGKYEAKIRLHREVSFDFPFEIIPDKKA